MKHKRMSAKTIALCGLLTALALVLGYVESMLPIVVGVSGIKLGLSNGVLIFALYALSAPIAWVLMLMKVALSGLLFGGVSTMMYSLAGGVLSMLVMTLLKRGKGISPVTVSMAGGVAHNVGQTMLAMLILQTSKLLYYMAVLMLVGLATGALTGVCATAVIKHLKALDRH